MRVLAIAGMYLIVVACAGDEMPRRETLSITEQAVDGSPANAKPVPADYNGDGFPEVALKGSNGVWYVDVGVCSQPTRETACSNDLDDDSDGFINDGCPGVGKFETICDDLYDNDGDLLVNDGCPYCMGQDRFGGSWDFAYAGYGNDAADAVPADYGRSDGTVDTQHRADLAIKDPNGMWAIDYADNGFGTWDEIRYGYGSGTPVPADYDGDGRADLAVKTSSGHWLIDYAYDGFYGWDPPNAGCVINCNQLPAIYGGTA